MLHACRSRRDTTALLVILCLAGSLGARTNLGEDVDENKLEPRGDAHHFDGESLSLLNFQSYDSSHRVLASSSPDDIDACPASPPPPALKLGPSNWTSPAQFPVSWFKAYYNDPNDLTVQPQPIIKDPVTRVVYPLNLTSSDQVPKQNLRDPISFPPISLRGKEAQRLADDIHMKILETIDSHSSGPTCEKCIKSLQLAGELARRAPQLIPSLAVSLCETYKFTKRCDQRYGLHSSGPIIAQLLAFADLSGYDGRYICFNFFPISRCPLPPTSPLDVSKFINSTKPCNAKLQHQKNIKQCSHDTGLCQSTHSRKRLKVLHISDFHLDPRYAIGSEANCSGPGLCCRASIESIDPIKLPAPRFGYYKCDTPLALGMAAVQAIPILTGTDVKNGNGFDFTVYTGDLVAHDQDNELSRDYVEYIESLLFENWKNHLGGGPVYASIGNHDSYLQAQDAPHSLMPERLGKQFSWNYEHLSRLWLHNHWVSEDVARISRAHYGAYAVKRYDDLKIITLNTDLWYRANLFNYINMTNPDQSGMLKFLVEELQNSENLGESVWITGHVLSGWDGTNPLLNPTNLFYQIVDRYSPHVIKTILWGHTHEDQFQIFYTNNATNISADHAVATAWMGPSITPLTNLNSGFRMYEVDSETYEILDAHTWYSDISLPSAESSRNQTLHHSGLIYQYEYSTRDTYGRYLNWSSEDPLNATWWHLVTEKMLDSKNNEGLMAKFTKYQGKSSIRSPNCTNTECIESKVCYMRSGSAPIGRRCRQGYGSVQSPYKPEKK